jgi:glycosyltransferase involved in cell wall biosynthesis
LRKAFGRAGLDRFVSFHGSLGRQEVPRALQQAHIALVTSRYEAICHALLESMACACVPVASRIPGATDSVVHHGVNGFLCATGKASDFAEGIRSLASDRNRLAVLSAAARQTIQDRFTVDRVVRHHDDLLTSLLAQEPSDYMPIPLSAIREPNLSRPSWRRFVPQGVKNYVRTWAERFERSV